MTRSVTTHSTPVPPRDAATVLLLCDTADAGVGVYFQERPASMAFAPGMIVFPGGGVDPTDETLPLASEPNPAGCDYARSGLRSYAAAALRETFEECGVLFASTKDGSWVDPDRAQALHNEFLHGTPLSALLQREELHLRASTLLPWSRWITPEPEPLRFDAYFFATTPPPGQRPRYRAEVSETVHAQTKPARRVLHDIAAGTYRALPPTRAALVELAAFPTVQDTLRRPRNCTPVLGRPARHS